MAHRNASADFAHMGDDDQICHEFSHSFTDFSSSYLVGYKCDSEWLFILIVLAAIGLVVGQNVLATKEGQAARMALTTKKGTKQRDSIVWTLLWYTFWSSVLGTVHVLLVVGANVAVLAALMIGNLLGVWWSYHQQKADEHDPSVDLFAVLDLAKQHPEDKKFDRLRSQLRDFINKEPDLQPPPPATASSLELDGASRMTKRSRSGFAPYLDHGFDHSRLKL